MENTDNHQGDALRYLFNYIKGFNTINVYYVCNRSRKDVLIGRFKYIGSMNICLN